MKLSSIILFIFVFLSCGFVMQMMWPSVKDTLPMPKVPYGKLETILLESKYVEPRPIYIWSLDTDLKNSSQTYSVLYMHDGQMLFDPDFTWNLRSWNMADVIYELSKENKIGKVILVGISNLDKKRHDEYFPEDVIALIEEGNRVDLLSHFSGKSNSNNYLKFIVEELKPFIDKTYPVYTDREHTFMMGSSLGGMISLYALCKYPNVFSQIAALSTHWIGSYNDNKEIPDAINNYLKENLPPPLLTGPKVYMDYGSQGLDAYYGPYQKMVDKTFKDKGYNDENLMSMFFEGMDHNETDWSSRVKIPLLFLLGK